MGAAGGEDGGARDELERVGVGRGLGLDEEGAGWEGVGAWGRRTREERSVRGVEVKGRNVSLRAVRFEGRTYRA